MSASSRLIQLKVAEKRITAGATYYIYRHIKSMTFKPNFNPVLISG
jgi:hypothetical protein